MWCGGVAVIMLAPPLFAGMSQEQAVGLAKRLGFSPECVDEVCMCVDKDCG